MSIPKEKIKAIAVILFLLLAFAFFLAIKVGIIGGGRKITKSITIEKYETGKIGDNAQISGVFSESFLSTKRNTAISDKTKVLETYWDYVKYINKYRTIIQTSPELSSQAETLYEKGYVALVTAPSAFTAPCSIVAASKHTDENGALSIVLTAQEIDPTFTFSTSLDKSQQTTAVVFLKQEAALSAPEIAFLMK